IHRLSTMAAVVIYDINPADGNARAVIRSRAQFYWAGIGDVYETGEAEHAIIQVVRLADEGFGVRVEPVGDTGQVVAGINHLGGLECACRRTETVDQVVNPIGWVGGPVKRH